MKVECGITTCKHNNLIKGKYGICNYNQGNIILKWRLAADMGKGTIVMVECLMMELPDETQ